MKKTILLAVMFAATVSVSVYGQGAFAFDNLSQSNGVVPVTIGSNSVASEGAVGAYIGSSYTASLFYETGGGLSQSAFDAASPIYFAAADTQFIGTTGGSPTTDGAGLFGGGFQTLPVTGTVSVEIRAWWNGNGVSSYAQALAAGYNTGESIPVSVTLATGVATTPAMEGLQSFTVGVVPEPTTLALCGLGAKEAKIKGSRL